MKKINKTMLLVAAAVLAGCNGNTGNAGDGDSGGKNPSGETTELTILMSSDYLKGSNEDNVIKAVQEKFLEDTGISIKLNTLVYSKSDFADAASNVLASSSWDAAVSYLGNAGIDDKLIRQNGAADLQDHLLEDYCSNIVDKTSTMSYLTTLTDEVYGIPSVNESKVNAILVRKDWMKRVGYTDDAEEAANSGGTLKLLKTMGQFEDMLTKFRDQIPGCDIPLAGAPWDLEYVVTSGVVEGHPSYCSHSVVYENDGVSVKKVTPGYDIDKYEQVLNYAYQWAKEGLWESFESATTYNTRESWFFNNRVGVYVGNPSVKQLIRVARKFSKYNDNAELTVIGPLAAGGVDGVATLDSQGKEIKAFRKESPAFSGLVLNPKSSKQKVLLQYLNWVYASKENYELCKYGIIGQDWNPVGEDKYTYPRADYLANPSYSGTLCLLENISISNRTFADYTEKELSWFDIAKNAETYEDCLNGFFLKKPTDKAYNDFLDAQNKMVTNVIYKAWNGTVNPLTSHKSQTDGTVNFESEAAEYITWLTNQYIQAH